MAQFNCKYLTSSGKEQKKVLEAKTKDECMKLLKNQGFTVISCEEAVGLGKSLNLGAAKKVTQYSVISLPASTEPVYLL